MPFRPKVALGSVGLKSIWVAMVAAAWVPAGAQTWTWPGCPDVTNSSFSYTQIVKRGSAPDPTVWEPVQVAFDFSTPYTGGQPDVYWIEMDATVGLSPHHPAVKRYNGATQTVSLLGRLPAWTGPYGCITNCNTTTGGAEEGLTGVVLDPNFKDNRWIYFHWSPNAVNTYRISRFTVNGNALDMSSERVLLDIPSQRNDCCHTGGGLAFDDFGDLWISVGNNAGRGTNKPPTEGIDESRKHLSDEWGSSSTGGLRGGVLRIRPNPSGTPAYTSPAGNFRDYYGSRGFDRNKIRPEIFTKGARNNYRLAVDPVRRWLGYSDVGPDAPAMDGNRNYDEFNFRVTPAFDGWPYFVGSTNSPFSGGKSVSAPTNTSKWNAELNGLTTLPPAQAASWAFGGAPTGIALYRYDGDLQSNVKFPPHFTRKWFAQRWGSGDHRVVTLNDAGTAVVSNQAIFNNRSWYGPVDFKFGPDGAAYVVNYSGFFSSDNNAGIVRIAYMGTCRPNQPKLEKPTGITVDRGLGFISRPEGWLIHLGSRQAVAVPAGMTGLELFDMMGKKIWSARGMRPGEEFRLPADLPRGTFRYRWLPSHL